MSSKPPVFPSHCGVCVHLTSPREGRLCACLRVLCPLSSFSPAQGLPYLTLWARLIHYNKPPRDQRKPQQLESQHFRRTLCRLHTSHLLDPGPLSPPEGTRHEQVRGAPTAG